MSETTEREANNRRVYEWLGKCWHEPREARSTITASQGQICDKCGTGWLRYGENASKPPKNPDYYSPTGCLELIEAARARHYQMRFGCDSSGDYTVGIQHWEAQDLIYDSWGEAVTLPEAVVKAVLAVIDSLEGK